MGIRLDSDWPLVRGDKRRGEIRGEVAEKLPRSFRLSPRRKGKKKQAQQFPFCFLIMTMKRACIWSHWASIELTEQERYEKREHISKQIDMALTKDTQQ